MGKTKRNTRKTKTRKAKRKIRSKLHNLAEAC
jgi:hypothetical protein